MLLYSQSHGELALKLAMQPVSILDHCIHLVSDLHISVRGKKQATELPD